jgi:uncharacterized membrane protein HdeD (DUF308 family)
MEKIIAVEEIPVSHWSSLAWRGVASIAFGILAFAWPGITLAALTILFGAYALTDGTLALVVALQRENRQYRWFLLFDGILGIGAGIVTFLWPGISLLALILVIGIRAMVVGAFQIATAIQFRRVVPSPALYGLGGVASILFGLVTFVFPGMSALALLTVLAAYSIVFGVALLGLSFRMRRSTHQRAHGAAQPA